MNPAHRLRDALARLLLLCGVTAYSRRRPGELLILTFHRVLPEELRSRYPLTGLAVSPDELRWVLELLLPYFEVGTVSTLVGRQREGRLARPGLAITFDDGQWDNIGFAAPVLAGLGVPASFYLPTDYIGGTRLLWHDRAGFAWQHADEATRRSSIAALSAGTETAGGNVSRFLALLKVATPARRTDVLEQLDRLLPDPPDWARMLGWAEVHSLLEQGHEIGSHACSHGLLPQMDTEEQRRELVDSARAIEQATGEPPRSLCYPNGSFDDATLMLAASTGYDNAVTTRWGINRPDQHRFTLLRCDIDSRRLLDSSGRPSASRLALRLSGIQPGL